jgi:hypothetical protein
MSEPAEPRPYRIPAPLRDLVMLDLLELTGSTTATAELLALTQPSVSRRYRSVALELGLSRQDDAPLGRRFADAPWVTLLRRGVNHQRLAGGVLRVGGNRALEDAFSGVPWVQWIGLGREQQQQWRQLLALELVDAIALSEPPDLRDGPDIASLPLIQLRCRQGRSLVLLCRRDPLVLEILRGAGLSAARLRASGVRPPGGRG